MTRRCAPATRPQQPCPQLCCACRASLRACRTACAAALVCSPTPTPAPTPTPTPPPTPAAFSGASAPSLKLAHPRAQATEKLYTLCSHVVVGKQEYKGLVTKVVDE